MFIVRDGVFAGVKDAGIPGIASIRFEDEFRRPEARDSKLKSDVAYFVFKLL